MDGRISSSGITLLVNQRFDQLIADKFSFSENLRFACMGRFPSVVGTLGSPTHHLEFVDRFHIDIHKPVYMLSGGQRQILALLMVLQKQVDVLLLDEPTATLDEENAVLVFEFLKGLTLRGITVVTVCHNRELVEGYVSGQNYSLVRSNGTSVLF